MIRNILLAIMVSLSAMVAPAQTDIKTVIADANKNCPVDMGQGLTFKGLSLTDEAIVFDFALSADMYDQMLPYLSIMHDSVLAQLLTDQDPSTQSILNYCRSNNIGITQRFSNPDNKHFDIVLTGAELK